MWLRKGGEGSDRWNGIRLGKRGRGMRFYQSACLGYSSGT